jgi:hypothetical protein
VKVSRVGVGESNLSDDDDEKPTTTMMKAMFYIHN